MLAPKSMNHACHVHDARFWFSVLDSIPMFSNVGLAQGKGFLHGVTLKCFPYALFPMFS